MAEKDTAMSFAERMMKNMGWSEGKGLGKQETGMKDFIKPKMKFNTKGIGFLGVDNKWIAHQEHFDDLLTSLNKGEKAPQKKDIACLTSESKLRGRTKFYAKMMRGKDLSNRSSKDLSAIIVPLSKKDEVEKSETDKLPSESDGTLKASHVSVNDYFAKMMAQRKAKLSHLQLSSAAEAAETAFCDEFEVDVEVDVEVDNSTVLKEEKTKKKRKKTTQAQDIETEEMNVDAPVEKRKKTKKQKLEHVQCEQQIVYREISAEDNDLLLRSAPNDGQIDVDPDIEPEQRKKNKQKNKKKKKKSSINGDDDDDGDDHHHCGDGDDHCDEAIQSEHGRKESRPATKKSKKTQNETDSSGSYTDRQREKVKKAKKLRQGHENSEQNSLAVNVEDNHDASTLEKSKSKSKSEKKLNKHKFIGEEFQITEQGTRLNVDIALLKEIRGNKLAKSRADPVRQLTDEQIQEIYRLWTSGEYAKFMRKIHGGELPRWVAIEKPQLDRMLSGRTKLIDLADIRQVLDTKWKTANVDEIWGYTNLAYLAV